MDILITNTDSRPIYEQIYTQIKGQIIVGQLGPGDPLPSMRLLAKELRVSVITTKRAYEELERDGFIISQTGRGSFVAKRSPALMQEEMLRIIEQHFEKAVDASRLCGLTLPELIELLTTLYQEDKK